MTKWLIRQIENDSVRWICAAQPRELTVPKIPADDMNLKGSMERRLNPDAHPGLNMKIGAAMPRPLVRETSGAAVRTGPSNAVRRRLAGLPERFTRGEY